MANLFGATNKVLVEFKAGIMTSTLADAKIEGTKAPLSLVPDKRKGLIQLVQSSDQLMHFIWKDRTTGLAEEDSTIFPEETVFRRVKQTNGRIFVLEFKDTSRRMFFWAQEGATDKDDAFAEKVNHLLNNPPSGDTDQEALFQMLQNNPTALGSSNPAVTAEALQNMLRSVIPTATSNPSAATSNLPPNHLHADGSGLTLGSVLTADGTSSFLTDPSIQEQLLPFLPAERRTPQELQEILRSPQIQASLRSFTAALQSGEISELMRQFGLEPNGVHTVEEFLTAIQRAADSKKDKDNNGMDTQ
eukprot:TRINITY_DN19769_c0_g1_i1.p1 TRINITY_DN19769_c0_g1~~TRINITY_DN19769_c0_g1_i1.p1  ORF type:complete len:303 (-),score=68.03 TRINITY_DN19769_c0_g1_i1:36-944(-)